jgi:hypothetical protein
MHKKSYIGITNRIEGGVTIWRVDWISFFEIYKLVGVLQRKHLPRFQTPDSIKVFVYWQENNLNFLEAFLGKNNIVNVFPA